MHDTLQDRAGMLDKLGLSSSSTAFVFYDEGRVVGNGGQMDFAGKLMTSFGGNRETKNLIVDLSTTNGMSAQGVQVLRDMKTICEGRGGKLVVLDPHSLIEDSVAEFSPIKSASS